MYQSLFIHSPSEGHLGHFQNLANMKKTAMSIPVLVFVVVQSPSCVQLFATPWTAAHQASLSLTISQSLPSSFSLHQWCHPAFSSSDALFSFCPQSFPASGSFLMSWLFTPGGQSIGASASASLLPMNLQDWFPLGLLVWSPYCPRDSQDLLQHHSLKASILQCSDFFMVSTLTSIHD